MRYRLSFKNISKLYVGDQTQQTSGTHGCRGNSCQEPKKTSARAGVPGCGSGGSWGGQSRPAAKGWSRVAGRENGGGGARLAVGVTVGEVGGVSLRWRGRVLEPWGGAARGLEQWLVTFGVAVGLLGGWAVAWGRLGLGDGVSHIKAVPSAFGSSKSSPRLR